MSTFESASKSTLDPVQFSDSTNGLVQTLSLAVVQKVGPVNTNLPYDGNCQLTSSTGALGSVTYTYDSNGLRIEKVSGSTTTVSIFAVTRPKILHTRSYDAMLFLDPVFLFSKLPG
jgi:YD repeat-containing protein